MRFELRISPDRLKSLNQIGSAHDIYTKAADQLDRAGIHTRDIGHRIERRILHRDPPRAVESRGQKRPLLLP